MCGLVERPPPPTRTENPVSTARRLRDRRETDVVDLGDAAPRGAAGDGDFEFARQVVELGVAAELAVDLQGQGRGIAEFVRVETGDRAAGDVPGDVAARADGGQARAPQRFDDVWKRLDGDPVQLNILADGNVGNTASVAFGEIGDRARLLAGEQAVGNANAHHKKRHGPAFAVFAANYADSVALGVNAPGTKVRAKPFRRNGTMALAGEFLDFVEMLPGVLFAFQPLDALCFGFFDLSHLRFLPALKTKNPRCLEPLARGLRNLTLTI